MKPLLAALSVAVTGGLLAFDAPQPAASFVVKLEGFTVEYSMVKVPGAADGSVKPLFVGKTEVPWELYDIFMLRLDLTDEQRASGVDAEARPTKAYGSPDRGFGHDGYAALGMSRLSAEKFCEWLSRTTGRTFRLPTELEWQHAARGGAADVPTGDALRECAWFADNSDAKPHPIATKSENGYGLHDMLGNLAEWVAAAPDASASAADTKDAKRPAASPAKKERVAKGGAFDSAAADTSVDARRVETPAWNKTDPQFPKSKWWLSDASFVGFRVVCEEATDAAR